MLEDVQLLRILIDVQVYCSCSTVIHVVWIVLHIVYGVYFT